MPNLEALALDDPAMMRAAIQRELVDHHRDRTELLDELRALRAHYRQSDHPELEDAVLDAMDMLVGWTGPAGRL